MKVSKQNFSAQWYGNTSYADFRSEFLYLVGKHAPVKKGYIRANQKNFLDKELNQAIMVTSKLCNKFLKLKTEENRHAHAKQPYYCLKLLQQKKRQYFENLNLSSITDIKLFWKTLSPLFTEKDGFKNNKITLVEGGKVLADNANIAETFDSFFGNTVNTLNTEKDESIFCDTGDETDRLLCAIKKYSEHPSILRIKQCFKNPTEFSFVLPVDRDVIAKEIKNLNTKKAARQDDIAVKLLKLNNDIFSQNLSQIFNESIEAAIFPNELKYADTISVYKKHDRHKKENYRPVSTISVISKTLERCLYDQIYKNINNTLSRHQMGYQKG